MKVINVLLSYGSNPRAEMKETTRKINCLIASLPHIQVLEYFWKNKTFTIDEWKEVHEQFENDKKVSDGIDCIKDFLEESTQLNQMECETKPE